MQYFFNSNESRIQFPFNCIKCKEFNNLDNELYFLNKYLFLKVTKFVFLLMFLILQITYLYI